MKFICDYCTTVELQGDYYCTTVELQEDFY